MKKVTSGLFFLMVLSACGGGSSSHGGPQIDPAVAPRPQVTAAVSASNKQITNMASEVVVASNSNEPISIVRAKSIDNGGVTYVSYRLDDVKLFTAQNLDKPGHSYINLELNENTGEIDAVKMVVGGVEGNRTVRDTKDTAAFAGKIFEYVKNGDDRAQFRVVDNGQDMSALNTLATENGLSDGHWNRIDERMVFKTYGKDVGLQYCDFGYFNSVYRSKNKNLTTDEEINAARHGTLNRNDDLDKYRDDNKFNEYLAKKDYQLLAGGYAISGTNMVDTLTPENNTTYKGKALGRVYVSIESKQGGIDKSSYLSSWNVPFDLDTNNDGIMDAYSNNAGHDMAKAYTTSEATMNIDANGNQTLFMPFNTKSDNVDKFYDVTISKNKNGNVSVDFSGTPSDQQYVRNNNETNIEGDFTPGYYGVNTPVEAAGTARYFTKQDIGKGSDAGKVNREWEVQAAYGMKKQ